MEKLGQPTVHDKSTIHMFDLLFYNEKAGLIFYVHFKSLFKILTPVFMVIQTYTV
jgi:hypothetical protein